MFRLSPRFIKLAVLLTPVTCFAASHKIAPDLAGVSGQSTVSVIVQFSSPLDNTMKQKMAGRGATLTSELGVIRSAAYSIPASALSTLADDPQVVYIAPDRPVGATMDYAASTLGAQIALQYGWDGSGIGVAVIDSGITLNQDLKDPAKAGASRIVYSQSFVSQSPTGN